MLEMNKVKRPGLTFIQMDATDMTYDDGSFSVVLDKGTLDALMSDTNESTVALVNKYLEVCIFKILIVKLILHKMPF